MYCVHIIIKCKQHIPGLIALDYFSVWTVRNGMVQHVQLSLLVAYNQGKNARVQHATLTGFETGQGHCKVKKQVFV